MDIKKNRKQPPIWLLIIIFFTIFLLISIGVTCLFELPIFLYPFPQYWGIIIGITLLVIGFYFLINALRSLKIKRALGKELYKSDKESTLITTGIYNYTRNPLYLGSAISFSGWFFFFLLTFLLIMTLLFIILFLLVAKWEEKELSERFGEEYLNYKKSVPFFFPRPRKRFKN